MILKFALSVLLAASLWATMYFIVKQACSSAIKEYHEKTMGNKTEVV